jgi:hypothetical protein
VEAAFVEAPGSPATVQCLDMTCQALLELSRASQPGLTSPQHTGFAVDILSYLCPLLAVDGGELARQADRAFGQLCMLLDTDPDERPIEAARDHLPSLHSLLDSPQQARTSPHDPE